MSLCLKAAMMMTQAPLRRDCCNYCEIKRGCVKAASRCFQIGRSGSFCPECQECVGFKVCLGGKTRDPIKEVELMFENIVYTVHSYSMCPREVEQR